MNLPLALAALPDELIDQGPVQLAVIACHIRKYDQSCLNSRGQRVTRRRGSAAPRSAWLCGGAVPRVLRVGLPASRGCTEGGASSTPSMSVLSP